MNFKKGDKLRCIGARTATGKLTEGKIYVALTDTEPGIFPSSPYITVQDDEGRRYSCHVSRFESAGSEP